MDGSLLRDGDRYVLRFERHLRHPVDRVWRSVTEPSELAHWFPGAVEIELATGGQASFTQPGFDVDPELLPTTGVVMELDPPRLIAFTWGDDLLRFELTPGAQGCLLVLSHRFENRASAPRSAAGWNVCVDSLVAHGEGTAGAAADGGGSWSRYHERHRDELGSDGICTRQGDTAVLRFERVLEHGAGEVWDALTRPDRLRAWLGDAAVDATEGGRVVLHFDHPPGYEVNGTVTRIDAPHVLEYTWTSPGEPEGIVKWQLIPMGDRCILLFTHTVHGHWDEAGTLAAWHVYLALLATSLAGLPTWPFPDARWGEVRERYAPTAR